MLKVDLGNAYSRIAVSLAFRDIILYQIWHEYLFGLFPCTPSAHSYSLEYNVVSRTNQGCV